MIRGKMGRLPKERTCRLQKNKNFHIEISSTINSKCQGKVFGCFQKLKKDQLASSFARSCGSRLQPVRTWRTIEGFADNGNSPGVASPKQWRVCRLAMVGIGWSVMLWYWRVGVPLVVASMGTAQFCSAQINQDEKI